MQEIHYAELNAEFQNQDSNIPKLDDHYASVDSQPDNIKENRSSQNN